jgi:hypothetical protein
VPTLILIVNVLSTAYMVGVIWMVQLVHYPLFAGVGLGNFIEYQKRHQTLMAFVVGPPMLLEASSSVALAWYPPPGVSPLDGFYGDRLGHLDLDLNRGHSGALSCAACARV